MIKYEVTPELGATVNEVMALLIGDQEFPITLTVEHNFFVPLMIPYADIDLKGESGIPANTPYEAVIKTEFNLWGLLMGLYNITTFPNPYKARVISSATPTDAGEEQQLVDQQQKPAGKRAAKDTAEVTQ